ncbi:MAG: hypothetical protein JW940_20345 [Polyangiaceae bacterium]|nr:hypothetical protein [Polyangiaceae bacterium]
MSTSRVESVAVVLGLVALLGAACSAAESEGDVDFQEKTGGRPSSGTGGNGGRGSGTSGGTSAGGSATSGGGPASGGAAAGCPAAKPTQGAQCPSGGMVCPYDDGTTCTCRMRSGWDCSGP